MKNIDKRIDKDITINEDLFLSGLLDITDFLLVSLKAFLEKEGRFLGIVKSYMSSIDIAFEKFNNCLEDEDYEIFAKLLYLLKPIIIKEFNRLRRKKISEGDCVILIMRKLLNIIEENSEYSYKREVKTILKIINKLFNNIRNKGKKDVMYNFSNQIKILKSSGNIGKYSLDKLDLTQLVREKSLLEDDGLRVDLSSENSIIDLG
jgi:hypothetical protein